MDQVSTLKKQGNDAFKAGDLDKAADFYLQAINLTDDDAAIAILYSNRAQAFLEQEKYPEALVAANKSLEHNPTFKKSILRRACANIELGNCQDAAQALRILVRNEPENFAICSLLEQALPSASMNSNFMNIFTFHALRRVITKNYEKSPPAEAHYHKTIKFTLSRLLFLSTRSVPYLRRKLDSVHVTTHEKLDIPMLSLPFWFKGKRTVVELANHHAGFCLSAELLKLILDTAQPENTVLYLGTEESAELYVDLYKYKAISCPRESFYFRKKMDPKYIPLIESGVEFLTVLPYFHEIYNLKDKSFPKLRTIYVQGFVEPTMEFLKLWKAQEWKVENLIIEFILPNMKEFARFKGKVSTATKTLYLPLIDLEDKPSLPEQFNNVKSNLQVMKRLFPSLDDVCGTIDIYYQKSTFPLVKGTHIKKHLKFLVESINQEVRPDWLPKLKILVKFIAVANAQNTEDDFYDSAFLYNLANECKRAIPSLDAVKFGADATMSFSWREEKDKAKIIEMSTKFADFQFCFVSFRTKRNDIRCL